MPLSLGTQEGDGGGADLIEGTFALVVDGQLGQGRRNGQRRQGGGIGKYLVPHGGQLAVLAAQGHAGQAAVVIENRAAQGGQAVREGHGLQLFAQPESTVAHLGQGVGQVNGLDGGSPEALGSNGGHALGDGHVRQRRGAVKEVLAQNGNALLHHDLGNLGHVGLPGLAVLGIIRGGCAGAGQRQHAVGVTPVHVTGGAGGLGSPGHGGQAHAEDQCQAQHQAQKPFDCRLHTFLLLK